jgi:hypothetical protein
VRASSTAAFVVDYVGVFENHGHGKVMQVECQVAVRKAQAFAAFCNAENAMLSSKRKLCAELGRVASAVFTNRQVNGRSLLG